MTMTRINDPLLAYPVGAIYMSVSPTSPATLFGGTWERITGRFLLAATDGGSSGASQAAGNIGGEAAHTLTAEEMPSHTHTTNIGSHEHTVATRGANRGYYDTGWEASGYGLTQASMFQNRVIVYREGLDESGAAYSVATDLGSKTSDSAGGGQAHSIMPPYLSVYVWKRTA
jgi:microcystin-dependent protein